MNTKGSERWVGGNGVGMERNSCMARKGRCGEGVKLFEDRDGAW